MKCFLSSIDCVDRISFKFKIRTTTCPFTGSLSNSKFKISTSTCSSRYQCWSPQRYSDRLPITIPKTILQSVPHHYSSCPAPPIAIRPTLFDTHWYTTTCPAPFRIPVPHRRRTLVPTPVPHHFRYDVLPSLILNESDRHPALPLGYSSKLNLLSSSRVKYFLLSIDCRSLVVSSLALRSVGPHL